MKITLDQVKEKSKARVPAGPDAGKTILERNLDRMKNWKKSQVEALFDKNDKLVSPVMGTQEDHKTISSSRKHVRKAIQAIIKDAKMKDANLPGALGGTLANLTNKLISKENILKKFKNDEIEYPN